MRESRVIEQNGVFLGAAVRLERSTPQGWRFVAVNGRVAALNGTRWPSLEALRHAAASGFAGSREASPAPVRRAARPAR